MPPIMNFFGDQTLFNCTSEPLVHSEILGAHHDRGNDSFLGLALTTNRSEHGTQGAEWAADGVGSQFFTGRITDNHWAGLDLDASLIQTSPDIQEQVPQQQQQDQDQQMAGPLIGYDEPECSCSCSPEAVPGLARTSPLFNRGKNQRLSFDIELSQIKRAIIGCEASVNCQSHAADPSMAMLMGVMIGGIIDGFEKLLVKDNPPAANGHNPQSPSCTPVAAQSADGRIQVAAGIGGKPKNGDQDSTMAEPRLTWGVLQLEDDDEADLRLRLCVLYFRRLEVLLKHFSQSVRFFRDGQDDQAAGVRSSAAQVMACDYMRIWLEEKAENNWARAMRDMSQGRDVKRADV
ncbi:unnamed protein product [Clonostachys rosea f. rosea IK726]|uniref:Uncharacterized protein n=1 Tax=Clonostachys rosea f. rosea IK726 TaxID=1349383 RepID=A0ACA9UL76_BIOOC|nr:unnamed protein product [Clonostachys rosea f. rosea IK726]